MGFLDARFGAYLAVAALLIVTPGPDTALVTRNALLAGRRAASFTTLRIRAGTTIYAHAELLGNPIPPAASLDAYAGFLIPGVAHPGSHRLDTAVATLSR